MPNCGYLNDLHLNGLHIGQRIRGSTAVHLGQFFERAQPSIPAELSLKNVATTNAKRSPNTGDLWPTS